MMAVTAVALVLSSNIVQIVNVLGETTLSMVSQLEMDFAMMITTMQNAIMMVVTAVALV